MQQKLSVYQINFTSATYSPFGKLLAAGSNEGALFIWDMSVRGVRRKIQLDHTNPISQLMYHALSVLNIF